MTMESSSAKSAAIGSFVAPLGRATSTPASGCGNAISRIAVTTPPSLSVVAAEMSRTQTQNWVASHAFLKYARSSMSGRRRPPGRKPEPARPAEPALALLGAKLHEHELAGSQELEIGVTVFVTSGTVT